MFVKSVRFLNKDISISQQVVYTHIKLVSITTNRTKEHINRELFLHNKGKQNNV